MLLPSRDASATLAQAMESLVSQTFGNFEIVAVDDGSSDNTLEILRHWARLDSRVRVETTDPRGIVSALNSALINIKYDSLKEIPCSI